MRHGLSYLLMLFASSRELIVPLAGARLGLSVSEVAIATAVGFVVDSVLPVARFPSLSLFLSLSLSSLCCRYCLYCSQIRRLH
jgi:ABC-type bacteriocin/lantibiotic exporter with double-glycine peptidase domain